MMQTDQLFTRQKEMAGLGIYHFGARFLRSAPEAQRVGSSPYTNRFLSADTVVPNPSDPQAFNRYSYAYNNPLRYIDPSGHASVCGFSYSDPACSAPDPWKPLSNNVSSGGGVIFLDPGLKQNKPRVYEPVVVEEPEGPTTIQLAQDGISGLYLTIFPEDSAPSVDRTSEQLESAEDWAAWVLQWISLKE